jgi:hypothetical protein
MSFIQEIRPGPRFLLIFRNKLIFYGEDLFASRSTTKLEDHPLSALRDCLFNIFAATLHSWSASPPSATWGRTVSWWQGTHLTSATWGRTMSWWQGTHLTSATWGRVMSCWQGTHLTSATWGRTLSWWQGTHLICAVHRLGCKLNIWYHCLRTRSKCAAIVFRVYNIFQKLAEKHSSHTIHAFFQNSQIWLRTRAKQIKL